MTDFLNRIRDLVAERPAGPLFVHSDAMRALEAIEMVSDVQEILRRHIAAIETAADGRDVWFPTFNYKFMQEGTYNVAKDKCQIGRLNETARKKWATWRSEIPVFNVCGNCEPLPSPDFSNINAFSDNSVFDHLRKQSGTIMFYGAPFLSITASHYVEQLDGGPVYRYDKVFRGTVISADGQEHATNMTAHCRPMGHSLTYDVQKMEADVESAGLLHKVTAGGSTVSMIEMEAVCGYWTERLAADPSWRAPHCCRTTGGCAEFDSAPRPLGYAMPFPTPIPYPLSQRLPAPPRRRDIGLVPQAGAARQPRLSSSEPTPRVCCYRSLPRRRPLRRLAGWSRRLRAWRTCYPSA